MTNDLGERAAGVCGLRRARGRRTVENRETDCAHDGYCRWTRDCATEIDRCVPSMLCGYGCAPGLSCQEIELPLVDGSCEDPVPTMLCLP